MNLSMNIAPIRPVLSSSWTIIPTLKRLYH